MGFPCGSAGKESTCNAGDLGSIPGLGRSPGEEKGYPLQYSGLENSIVHGVSKSRTRLSDCHGLPWWFSSKESTCDAGDMVLISGSGRSPGEENGNSLQYLCLGNPMDMATVHGVAKELEQKQHCRILTILIIVKCSSFSSSF